MQTMSGFHVRGKTTELSSVQVLACWWAYKSVYHRHLCICTRGVQVFSFRFACLPSAMLRDGLSRLLELSSAQTNKVAFISASAPGRNFSVLSKKSNSLLSAKKANNELRDFRCLFKECCRILTTEFV